MMKKYFKEKFPREEVEFIMSILLLGVSALILGYYNYYCCYCYNYYCYYYPSSHECECYWYYDYYYGCY